MQVSVSGCSIASTLFLRLRHLHVQLFGLLSPHLLTIRRRQVGCTSQRVWMPRPMYPRARLYHSYKELFSFRLSLSK